MRIDAKLLMRFPRDEKTRFRHALKDDKEAVDRAVRVNVQDAQSRYEFDRYMILAEIQRHFGSRETIEKICKALGLDVIGDAVNKDESLSWLDQRSEDYFLRKSARGCVDGTQYVWNHESGTLYAGDSSEIVHRLSDGLDAFNKILSERLVASLHHVASQMSMRILGDRSGTKMARSLSASIHQSREQ